MGYKRWVKQTVGGGGGNPGALPGGMCYIEFLPPFTSSSSIVNGKFLSSTNVAAAPQAYVIADGSFGAISDALGLNRIIRFSQIPTVKHCFCEAMVWTSGSNGEIDHVQIYNNTDAVVIADMTVTSSGSSNQAFLQSADVVANLPTGGVDKTFIVRMFSSASGALRCMQVRMILIW